MSLLNDDSGPDRLVSGADCGAKIVLSGLRVLILEEEYLIALDIQRILEQANATAPALVRSYEELASLPRLAEFDLAIVTPPRPGSADLATAELLASAGPAIVVCSAARTNLANTPLHGAEFVEKPFADEELLAACARALAARR